VPLTCRCHSILLLSWHVLLLLLQLLLRWLRLLLLRLLLGLLLLGLLHLLLVWEQLLLLLLLLELLLLLLLLLKLLLLLLLQLLLLLLLHQLLLLLLLLSLLLLQHLLLLLLLLLDHVLLLLLLLHLPRHGVWRSLYKPAHTRYSCHCRRRCHHSLIWHHHWRRLLLLHVHARVGDGHGRPHHLLLLRLRRLQWLRLLLLHLLLHGCWIERGATAHLLLTGIVPHARRSHLCLRLRHRLLPLLRLLLLLRRLHHLHEARRVAARRRAIVESSKGSKEVHETLIHAGLRHHTLSLLLRLLLLRLLRLLLLRLLQHLLLHVVPLLLLGHSQLLHLGLAIAHGHLPDHHVRLLLLLLRLLLLLLLLRAHCAIKHHNPAMLRLRLLVVAGAGRREADLGEALLDELVRKVAHVGAVQVLRGQRAGCEGRPKVLASAVCIRGEAGEVRAAAACSSVSRCSEYGVLGWVFVGAGMRVRRFKERCKAVRGVSDPHGAAAGPGCCPPTSRPWQASCARFSMFCAYLIASPSLLGSQRCSAIWTVLALRNGGQAHGSADRSR
jgi:hypothetical protein